MAELGPIKFKFGSAIEWEEWRNVCIPRLMFAQDLLIPHLPQLEPHENTCVIVGAAPQVERHRRDIRKLLNKSELNLLMSINASHNWLCKNKMPPHIHVISEFDLEDVSVALGGSPHRKTTYYVASCCGKKIFDQLKGHKRVLYHMFLPPQGYQQCIGKFFPNEFMVAGGFATFFKTVNVALILGYRSFELFGLDSSFEGDRTHMDNYALSNKEQIITVWGKNERTGNMKKFKTTGGLAFQAYEFLRFCKENQAGLKIRVHGSGLLRYVHESCYSDQYKQKDA